MSKSMIIVLVLILVAAGAFIINNQNQKAAQLEQMQLREAEEAKNIEARQARQRALEEARRVEAEAQRAKQAALEEAKKLEEAAKQQDAELQTKIGGLIAQAKSLLDGGKYQEAIDMAKNILSQDANNSEAKSILETAMAKLKEMAQEQATSLIKEDPKKALGVVTSGVTIP